MSTRHMGRQLRDAREIVAMAKSPLQVISDAHANLGVVRGVCEGSVRYEKWRKNLVCPVFTKCDKKTKEGRQKAKQWAIRQVEMTNVSGDAVVIHVDGSMKGPVGSRRVGAGAVINIPGCEETTHAWYLEGAESAYAGEITAIGLAMEEVRKVPEARGRFVIVVSDCQSAIVKIIATKHESINTVRVRRAIEDWEWGVRFVWVPSHVGYDPNDGADIAAGEGADGVRKNGTPVPVVVYAHDVRREIEKIKQGGIKTAEQRWSTGAAESTLRKYASSGKFADYACASAKCEKVYARIRMGSPVVPSDWGRKEVCDIGGEDIVCKGCGERNTDWNHLVFECCGYCIERKELFEEYVEVALNPPVKIEDFMKPKRKDNSKWSVGKMGKIKEMFSMFICNTVYSEARVVLDDEDDDSDVDSLSDEMCDSSESESDFDSDCESDSECEDADDKVIIGSMVKVNSWWNEDGKEKGELERKWYLARVVDFAPGGWIEVHYWRSYGEEGDPNRVYSPVWLNKKEDKEVYMLDPKGPGGFKGAKEWKQWYKPKEIAVMAIAECEEAPKGVRVKKWHDDFYF